MAILSLNDWMASQRETLLYRKTASRTAVAAMLTNVFDQTGTPGAGTLAGTSVAAGVVPDDATAGANGILNFPGGGKGYLTRASFFNSVTGNIYLFDVLFKAGAYSYNASQTLSSQPDFKTRCPDNFGGTSWGKGNQIMLEQVTAATGNQSVAVTYTNQDGATSHTTGTIGTGAAFIVGRCVILPLQAGDTGVQKIESVTGTVASAGTFNILVVRQIAKERIRIANEVVTQDLLKIGMPQVYENSCIVAYIKPDSTATGLPEIEFDISSK